MKITKEMTCIITGIIQELGLMPHLKGYHYIRTAIEMILEDVTYLDKITALYAAIARKYDTSSNKVERAIRHCIFVSTNKANSKTRSAYVKYVDSSFENEEISIHVINSLFLASIVDYIRLHYIKSIPIKKTNAKYEVEIYDNNFKYIQTITYENDALIEKALKDFVKAYIAVSMSETINCIIITDNQNSENKRIITKKEIQGLL